MNIQSRAMLPASLPARGRAAAKIAPFTFACYSVPHAGHPERNEDALLADRGSGLAAVLDGVGGSSAGAVASQLGAQVLRRAWRPIVRQQQPDAKAGLLTLRDDQDVRVLLEGLVEEAQTAISDEGERRARGAEAQQDADDYPATTVVVAALCRDATAQGYVMGYAHAGDSRIYLLRAGGLMQRLTQDDGYFLLKIQDSTLSAEDALRIDQATSFDQLTPAEREIFNKRNGISQSLGHFTPKAPSLTIHTAQSMVYPGDRILLCSDGIHDNLTDAEIESILLRGARTTVARRLVQSALERSKEQCLRAKQDDMSAIVITCNS